MRMSYDVFQTCREKIEEDSTDRKDIYKLGHFAGMLRISRGSEFILRKKKIPQELEKSIPCVMELNKNLVREFYF